MATAGRTAKLGDDMAVSALGFGAGALAVYGDADDSGLPVLHAPARPTRPLDRRFWRTCPGAG